MSQKISNYKISTTKSRNTMRKSRRKKSQIAKSYVDTGFGIGSKIILGVSQIKPIFKIEE